MDYPILSIWENTADENEQDVFTKSFVGYIYQYTSLLWTNRYNEPGDFEIYLPATTELLELLQPGYLVTRHDREREIAMIETVKLEQDAENGDTITCTGRMLTCLLENRLLVWNELRAGLIPESVSRNPPWQTAAVLVNIMQMIATMTDKDSSAYTSSDGRKFNGLISPSVSNSNVEDGIWTTDGDSSGFTPEFGTTYLDAMESLAKGIDGGFAVEYVAALSALSFRLYGEKYDKTQNYPEFSDKNGAITAMSFSHTNTNIKNRVYTAMQAKTDTITSNEKIGSTEETVQYVHKFGNYLHNSEADRSSGYALKEAYIQCDSNTGYDMSTTSTDPYALMNTSILHLDLHDNWAYEFTTDVNAAGYVYGKDYEVGSILHMHSYRYNISEYMRLTAMTESFDENGMQLTPEFETLYTDSEVE